MPRLSTTGMLLEAVEHLKAKGQEARERLPAQGQVLTQMGLRDVRYLTSDAMAHRPAPSIRRVEGATGEIGRESNFSGLPRLTTHHVTSLRSMIRRSDHSQQS